jgi:hypothetical protein
MKKNKILKSLQLILVCSLFLCNGILSAQTNGTFTLSLNTTSTGGYSPKHLIAIWIENSNPTFIKTKLMQSSDGNLDHLGQWTSRTAKNIVDATTGATLPSHGNVTVVWNGTDVNGTVVPDGTYTVWVEMAWASSLTTGKTYTTFTFTKGLSVFHSAPADLTNFTGITLDWVPGTATLVENVPEANNVIVFPNPTTGPLNFKFKNGRTAYNIRIFNDSGIMVYDEPYKEFSATDKRIDISSLAAGVYFVNFHSDYGDETIRIVKIN